MTYEEATAKIHRFIDRAKVVATAAVTYISLAIAAVVAVTAFVVPQLPEDLAIQVAGYSAGVVGFLTGVVSIIRRVTPVAPEERGILPQ